MSADNWPGPRTPDPYRLRPFVPAVAFASLRRVLLEVERRYRWGRLLLVRGITGWDVAAGLGGGTPGFRGRSWKLGFVAALLRLAHFTPESAQQKEEGRSLSAMPTQGVPSYKI